MRDKNVIVCLLIIIIILVAYHLFLNLPIKTVRINYYLDEGKMVTYSLRGYGSKLKISVTSTNDYMYVKIIANGQTIFEEDHLYELNKEFHLPYGYYYIDIIFKNPPTIFYLGPSISINGYVSLE